MSVQILVGDVFERLADLPDESINCVVTSPPYWGLRDYDVPGQIGREPSLKDHLDLMTRLFREVRRILRSDGTCWLNYGDCYATKAVSINDPASQDATGPVYVHDDNERRGGPCKQYSNQGSGRTGRIVAGGHLKPKDLCMIPARLAIALQEDGWWLRSEIVWHKPNPMPESVRDRPTMAHEKIFLLTKSARYFYDAGAVREKSSWNPEKAKMPDGWDTGPGAHGAFHRNGRQKGRKRGHSRPHEGFNGDWDKRSRSDQQGDGANLRNVWSIATRPFREAHFATFPPELVELCIKAGCPANGMVLDPFGGSGTTGLVADRLQRDCILIELNPDYAEIARWRLKNDAGMFAQITLEGPEPATVPAAG